MAGRKKELSPKQKEGLDKNKFTDKQSHDEAVKNGQKGGIASGEARRKKSTMSELARIVAESPVTNAKSKQTLHDLGFEEEDMNGNAVVVASLFNKTIKGDMLAYDRWQTLTDVVDIDDKHYDLPARVLGKAFVDINRNIVPNYHYVFKGGRGALKSSFISLKIVELIKNNPTMHCCAVRKVGGTLKDSVYSQIKWAINELGLEEEFKCRVSPLEIVYKKTGQTIYFRGVDDPVKLKSLKPEFGYIGILWVEEEDQLAGAEERRSITQSVLRGGNLSYDFSSYNPPKSRDNWVNQRELEENDKKVVHTSCYTDAPKEWLGQKFIDDAEHLKETQPSAYEHEYLGVANGDGGNVFENLEIREISNSEIDRFDHIYQGVDWGWYPDPFAFVRLNYDANREIITFIDEVYINKTVNEESARILKEKCYDDAFITCDSAEPKSVADFRACGLPAKEAAKGAGSVEYGMKWLQNRTIVIDPKRTPNVYREFVGYEFERDKAGVVISGYPDKDNHTIDATRYALERVYKKYGSVG